MRSYTTRQNPNKKYDIFISYRRLGGALYARNLQQMLERHGYRVFLDYDELRDGVFSTEIVQAIRNSKVYMIVLSENSMERTKNEDDWVRREIETAVANRKQIIPVNPDETFDGFPDAVPDHIKQHIGGVQFSTVRFGADLRNHVSDMIRYRIRPYVWRRRTKITMLCVAVLLILFCVCGVLYLKRAKDLSQLRNEVVAAGAISLAPNATEEQLLAIRSILTQLREVPGGEMMQGAEPEPDGSYHPNVEVAFETPAFKVVVDPFSITKYEITIGQWNAIMRDTISGNPALPVTSITFHQAQNFADSIASLTGLTFRLPTESEWEFAARGEGDAERMLYAGSNQPENVAWYLKNSHGVAYDTIHLRKQAVGDDIFNMSGNVSEWCDTEFAPYDKSRPYPRNGSKVVRGGNYLSEAYELSVFHREPVLPGTKLPTLGFRLVLNR